MVGPTGLEPVTPACKAGALPAELWSHFGAGEGDRTLTAGLEGQNSTIELHPHI